MEVGPRLIAAPRAVADVVTVAVVAAVRTEVTVDGPAKLVDVEVVIVAVTRQSDSQLNTESGDRSPIVWSTIPVPHLPVEPQKIELPAA